MIFDIRQRLVSIPLNSIVKPASGVNGGTTMLSANRRANATPVNIGLGEPTVGKRDGPAAYAFVTKWKRQLPSVTELFGSVPIESGPASWCVVPIPSRRPPSAFGL